MKNLFILLMLSCSLLSTTVYSQELTKNEKRKIAKQQRKIERKQKKELKRAFKKLYKRITKNPEMRSEFHSILNQCPDMDEACHDRLERATQEAVEGSNLAAQAGGLTFGICHPGENFQAIHKLVYSKRNYDCKLSSHGKVYNRSVERKLFGPGLIWDKQSVVLMCTGPAYGKSTFGSNLTLGVGFGISLGSSFGKVGLCLAVGAGKSIGFFVGGEKITFEELEKEDV